MAYQEIVFFFFDRERDTSDRSYQLFSFLFINQYTKTAHDTPITEPAYISQRKCWDRYTLEYATKSAIIRHSIFTGLLPLSIAAERNNAKAEAECPEGKLLEPSNSTPLIKCRPALPSKKAEGLRES
jgi:hypothetical protein